MTLKISHVIITKGRDSQETVNLLDEFGSRGYRVIQSDATTYLMEYYHDDNA